jgi:hypothetical protein
MRGKSQGGKEVCVVIAREGELDNPNLLYLHQEDGLNDLLKSGRASGELVGFIWFLPASDDVPNSELFEENVNDPEMLSCINMLVRTIQFNQIQVMRKLKM